MFSPVHYRNFLGACWVLHVSQRWLKPTRTGHKNLLTNQNHRLQVSGQQTIVLMCGNYPLSTCLWSLRINHVDWLFPYCSIPLIVFPRDFFGCLFYVYDCLWLSSPFLLLRPLKTTCNKQKTQQWFLTMMWFSPSRTQPCKFLNFIDLLFIYRPFPIIFPSNIRIH